MRERITRLAVLLCLLTATVLFAGCGSDDEGGGESADGDTDPQAILDRALGAGEAIDSGVLDLEFALESTAPEGGSLAASLTGPFQSSGDGGLPQLDFDAKGTLEQPAGSTEIDAGLTLTADGGYVSYAGEDYEIDPGTFELLQSSYVESSELQEQQGEENSLAQFGIDPSTWVTDLVNEGTTDLDGTEVVHVSGQADVGKLAGDLNSVAEQAGQGGQVDPEALAQLNDSVRSTTIDVYASTEDSTLRQFDLEIEVVDPSSASEDTTSVSLSIGIADPGEDQEISAPADPQPIEALLQQFPAGAQALQGLGGTGAATTAPPTTDGAGADGSSAAANAYFECAANAATAAAVDACADLLGG